jgi:hypothetical protein
MITEHDIRRYIMATDKVGGVLCNTPYMLLEMLINNDLSTEELRKDILYFLDTK